MRPVRPALMAWMIGLTAAVGSAQEPAPAGDSAPTADTIPGTFRSFIASDLRFPSDNVRNRQDKMHCLVCEAGLNPVVAVFARTDPAALTPDSPLGRLIKALGRPAVSDGETRDPGGYVAKHRAANAAAFAVFLTLEKPYPEDERGDAVKGLIRQEQAQALKTAAESLAAPGVPLGLAPQQSPTTDAWKLDPADEITVVVYNRMAVVKRWTFGPNTPLTDEAVDEIIAVADKTAGGQ